MILKDMKTRVVGVDIKLAKTTCAIVDLRGNIIATTDFPTADHPFIGDYVAVLCETILNLVESNGGYESIRSVGISTPSGNFLTGSIVNSPNMPWKGIIPLAAMMRDRLGLAVALANNAYATALGERTFGAAHGMRDFVVVSVGSGVGSCFYSSGHVHMGAEGFAGELGHLCYDPDGRECGCGNKGCLETYCAEKGIILNARELLDASDKPSLLRDAAELSSTVIIEACKKGDAIAIETMRRTGEIFGCGLATYASVIDPEAIIFTGTAARADHWMLEPAYKAFEEHVFHNINNRVKFIISTLDDHVRNILGASVLAWEVKEYSLFK